MLKIKQLFGKDRKVMEKVREKIAEEKKKRKIKNFIPAINIIVKGDMAGSVEALLDIFDTYTYDTICQLNIVHYGIGFITQSDIELADTFKGNILKEYPKYYYYYKHIIIIINTRIIIYHFLSSNYLWI